MRQDIQALLTRTEDMVAPYGRRLGGFPRSEIVDAGRELERLFFSAPEGAVSRREAEGIGNVLDELMWKAEYCKWGGWPGTKLFRDLADSPG